MQYVNYLSVELLKLSEVVELLKKQQVTLFPFGNIPVKSRVEIQKGSFIESVLFEDARGTQFQDVRLKKSKEMNISP